MTTGKITITMSERRPLTIREADWPRIAYGECFAGQYDFQSFDGAYIRVLRHADGRAIVYGYAGDWDGGGRPERENRRAGFLIEAGASGDAIIRAIRRVAGILEETSCVGEMAHAAARRCIADLPAEDDEEESVSESDDEITRALGTLDTIAASGIDPGYARDLAKAASVLRAALARSKNRRS